MSCVASAHRRGVGTNLALQNQKELGWQLSKIAVSQLPGGRPWDLKTADSIGVHGEACKPALLSHSKAAVLVFSAAFGELCGLCPSQRSWYQLSFTKSKRAWLAAFKNSCQSASANNPWPTTLKSFEKLGTVVCAAGP